MGKYILTTIVMTIVMVALGKFINKYNKQNRDTNENDLLQGYRVGEGYILNSVLTILIYLSTYIMFLVIYLILYVEKEIVFTLNNSFLDELIKQLIKNAPIIIYFVHLKIAKYCIKKEKKNENEQKKIKDILAIPTEDDVSLFILVSGLAMLAFSIISEKTIHGESFAYIVVNMVLVNILKSISSNETKVCSGEEKKKMLIFRVPLLSSLFSLGYIVIFTFAIFTANLGIMFGLATGIFFGICIAECMTKELVEKIFLVFKKKFATYVLIVALIISQFNM